MYISFFKVTFLFAIDFISILQCRTLENRSSFQYKNELLTRRFLRRTESILDQESTLNTETITLDGKPFTPFYVPLGSQVLYANEGSNLIDFAGSGWEDSPKTHGAGKETTVPGEFLEITWSGQDIRYYGFKGGAKERGVSRIGIYLDGQLQPPEGTLRCDIGESYMEQSIYGAEYLPSTNHTLKIVHEGEEGEILSVFAFVITDRTEEFGMGLDSTAKSATQKAKRADESRIEKWTLLQKGNTGVAAMQLSMINDHEAIIIDRVCALSPRFSSTLHSTPMCLPCNFSFRIQVEHNPLTINGHPAWAALYNLKTHKVRALNPLSNSFCAAGSFLGNGTLIK